MFFVSAGSLTALPACSVGNAVLGTGKWRESRENHVGHVGAKHWLDMSPKGAPLHGRDVTSGALPLHNGGLDGGNGSLRKTAELVATCTAAATAAVLEATHQVRNGRSECC